MSLSSTVPVLQARGLSRQFGHVRALNDVDFEVYPGEVTALIGDNGAGKSTLVKALSGNLAVDSGTILFDGEEADMSTPSAVSALGVETVYQDLALAPHLDPVQNMYLGRELRQSGVAGALGFMKTKEMRAQSRAAFDELGATVRSLTSPVGEMSGGQRQAIAIARAVHWASRVVFLDEPTAALGVRQTQNVLETIRRVRDKGIAVVFISHSMPHVMEVSDRIQVLRLGTRVANIPAADTSMEELVGLMTGAVTRDAAPPVADVAPEGDVAETSAADKEPNR
ncbi:ATP-binding cassette domain-containing protein [Microbacterium sp. K35]|uniref:ATP-binding cassette domain-containing protein n=1 Tax=Microbacterium sp. K35 TaxID=2305440 RepID=UPI00109BE4CB|nr:ATP-binding cassette domain-containing protein [Microbacterium sp. K35]